MMILSSGSVGIGTVSPSGVMDVYSTTSAFLPPRMTTTQRNAVASPIAGMMIYNSTIGEVEVYNGSVWAGIGSNLINGAIAAFASASCPTGWTEYTTARGAFLRGIDNGAGLDPSGTRTAGNYEADTFASHTHTVTDPGHAHGITDPGHYHVLPNIGYRGNSANSSGSSYPTTGANTNTNSAYTGISVNSATTGITGTNSTGSTETRPKNIAVIFCQYNGTGASMAAIALSSLSGVNISSPTAGQFLGYNGTAWVNTAGLTVLNTGSVGIGTTSPQVGLDVNAAAEIGSYSGDVHGFFGYDSGSGSFSIEAHNQANSTKKSIILNAWGGNVGIGTTGPGYTLDVNGAIHSNNNIYANYVSLNASSVGNVLLTWAMAAIRDIRPSSTTAERAPDISDGNAQADISALKPKTGIAAMKSQEI